MRIDVAVAGSVAEQMRREIAAGERAVSAAMANASERIKVDWRGQVAQAGLGRRLGNSIRARQFPGKPSLNAAALVWSNAPEILGAFERGALIRSQAGFWLAIPTPAAGRDLRGKRFTPLTWERRTGLKLRHVYRGPGRPALLVAEARVDSKGRARTSRSKTGRNLATVPIFLLLKQVRLKKRLDLAQPAQQWADRLPGLIVREWVDDRL